MQKRQAIRVMEELMELLTDAYRQADHPTGNW
jgi:hypothetical protein